MARQNTIQVLRGDTGFDITQATGDNYVLAEGELFYDTTTGNMYVGDGTSALATLMSSGKTLSTIKNSEWNDITTSSPLNFTFDETNMTASVSKYTGTNYYSGDITIPAKIYKNGKVYTVTKIEGDAFSKCAALTSVVMPNTIIAIASGTTSPNNGAFIQCTSLDNIIFSCNLHTIGSHAFERCSKLKFVDLPLRLNIIGGSAFYGCNNLSTINIKHNVTNIGNEAFRPSTGSDLDTVINYSGTKQMWENINKGSLVFYERSLKLSYAESVSSILGTGLVNPSANKPPLQGYNESEGTIEERLTRLGFRSGDLTVTASGVTITGNLPTETAGTNRCFTRQGNYVLCNFSFDNLTKPSGSYYVTIGTISSEFIPKSDVHTQMWETYPGASTLLDEIIIKTNGEVQFFRSTTASATGIYGQAVTGWEANPITT